jgi:hypothetical protein
MIVEFQTDNFKNTLNLALSPGNNTREKKKRKKEKFTFSFLGTSLA